MAATQNMPEIKFDPVVAAALSKLLGDIPIVPPVSSDALLPPASSLDCVEVGDTKVVGSVWAQNVDIAYHPDGIRIACDRKALNDAGSIKKHWNNMINDLAAEATTVHTRFPYALALFFVVIPKPAFHANQAADLIRPCLINGNLPKEEGFFSPIKARNRRNTLCISKLSKVVSRIMRKLVCSSGE